MQKNELIVILLLILQAIAVAMLWSLTSLTHAGQEVFTLFLAVDLLAVVVVSRVYRAGKAKEIVNRGWIVLAGALMLALLFATLLVA